MASLLCSLTGCQQTNYATNMTLYAQKPCKRENSTCRVTITRLRREPCALNLCRVQRKSFQLAPKPFLISRIDYKFPSVI